MFCMEPKTEHSTPNPSTYLLYYTSAPAGTILYLYSLSVKMRSHSLVPAPKTTNNTIPNQKLSV